MMPSALKHRIPRVSYLPIALNEAVEEKIRAEKEKRRDSRYSGSLYIEDLIKRDLNWYGPMEPDRRPISPPRRTSR